MVYHNPPPGRHREPTVLLVGEDGEGHWLVQENHGRIDEEFESRGAAVAFAESVRRKLPGAFLMVTPSEISRRPAPTRAEAA
jgi:hypothetical protein